MRNVRSTAQLVGMVGLLVSAPVQARNSACPFVERLQSFHGSPVEQARCLLRPVMRYGDLAEEPQGLPAPLGRLVGMPTRISRREFARFLRRRGVSEAELGGPMSTAIGARYFVIHDVSTPNYLAHPFPEWINDVSWRGNDLRRWQRDKGAHLYIDRVGRSVAARDLAVPWRATKFEKRGISAQRKGLFVHVELVQPRRRDPAGPARNDAIAPIPGFTNVQLDRLALAYVAASVRHGRWLIPAFHAALDAGMPDAHDDPQNFDTEKWARAIGDIVNALETRKRGV